MQMMALKVYNLLLFGKRIASINENAYAVHRNNYNGRTPDICPANLVYCNEPSRQNGRTKARSDFDIDQRPSCEKTPTCKRQVTKATFEKCQRDNDRDHQTLVSLCCELERDHLHVAFLFCDVCRRYKDSIVSLRNFQMTWITGTTNLKISVVKEHANSEIHKVAMGRLKSTSAKAKGESLFANSTIGQSLTVLDSTTQARMRRKFDVCYMMAKENIPLASIIFGIGGSPRGRYRPCI